MHINTYAVAPIFDMPGLVIIIGDPSVEDGETLEPTVVPRDTSGWLHSPPRPGDVYGPMPDCARRPPAYESPI